MAEVFRTGKRARPSVTQSPGATDGVWFQALVQAIPDGIIVADHSGNILFANNQTQTLFGFEEEEILGLKLEMLMPERFRDHHRALCMQFFAAPNARPMGAKLQLVGLRKAGTEFPVQISLSPVERGDGILVVSVIRDVTEWQLAHEARFRLAAIVESSQDAVVSKSVDGTIKTWNAGAQDIFGYSELETVGKPITILIPPELWDEERAIIERILAGACIEHYETTRVTKAGHKIDVSLTLSPIKDESGRIVGVSKIARNITEQKRAQAALTFATRKLIDAQERERTRIARELHDDICQRLALLAVDLDILQQEQHDLTSGVQNRLREFKRHLTDISTDLQSLSHELHSSKLEYLGLVGSMKSWCREVGERHKVAMEFMCDEVLSPVTSEVGLCLFRILQEALNNAVKYSGTRQVRVQLLNDSEQIRLIISDSGRGFDIKAVTQGRGLGLTSMRERVQLVNGSIAIHSKPRGGTTIEVRVPLPAANSLQRAAV